MDDKAGDSAANRGIMDQPMQILKKTVELERRLKEIEPDKNKTESVAVMNELLTLYQTLITDHTSFSNACGKDIDGQLWKSCWYRRIEEYRKTIKKHTQVMDKDKDKPEIVEKYRAHIANVNAGFGRFLTMAATSYQDMMLKLEKRAAFCSAKNGNSDRPKAEDLQRCIYRCLLYLGDIARYQEVYADSREKDFTAAESYYQRAAFVIPAAGNPQNQLAVLATYKESHDCVALYHYCRCTMVAQPFAGGTDNLVTLFEKNKQRSVQLKSDIEHQKLLAAASASLSEQMHEWEASIDIQIPLPSQGGVLPSTEPVAPWFALRKNKKALAIKLKHFSSNFVWLHGLLYKWTFKAVPLLSRSTNSVNRDVPSIAAPSVTTSTAMELDENHVSNGVSSSTTGAAVATTSLPFDFTLFSSLSQEILQDFDLLLSASALSEFFLIRLLVICVFSVHHGATLVDPLAASESGKNFDSSNANGSKRRNDVERLALERKPRSLSESLALTFLFRLMLKAARRLEAVSRQGISNRTAVAERILPVLSVFAEWAWEHPRYLILQSERSLGNQNLSSTNESNSSESSSSSSSSSSSLLGNQATGVTTFNHLAPSDVLLGENDARLQMKTAVCALQELVEASIRCIPGASGRVGNTKQFRVSDCKVLFVDSKGKPLKEQIELRGFSPLAARYEIFFSGIDPLTKQLPVIPEEPSRDRRLRTIRLLIREWPTPVVLNTDTAPSSDGNKLLGHISGAGILKVSADVLQAMSKGGGGGHDKSDHNHSHQRDRENQKKNKKLRRERERERENRDRGSRNRDRRDRDRGGERGGRRERDPTKQLFDPNADFPPRPSSTANAGNAHGAPTQDVGQNVSTVNSNRMTFSMALTRDLDSQQRQQDGSHSPGGSSEGHPIPTTRPTRGPPSVAVNYASSVMYAATAPMTADPFEDDCSDVSDDADYDDEEDDDEEQEEEEEEKEGILGGKESWTAFSGLFGGSQLFPSEPTGPGQGSLANTLNPASYRLPSERSGGGVMGEEVGNRIMDPAEGASVEVAMAVLGEHSQIAIARSVDEDEDDFADDVVVFRPAFSRPVDTPSPSFSPSTSASALNTIMGTSLLSTTPSISMNMGDRMMIPGGGGGNGIINTHPVGDIVHMNSNNTAGSSTGSSLSLVNKNTDPSIAYLASTLSLPSHAGSSNGTVGGVNSTPHVINSDELQSFLGGTSATSRPPLPSSTSHLYNAMGGSAGGGPPGLPPPAPRHVPPPPGFVTGINQQQQQQVNEQGQGLWTANPFFYG